MSHIYYIIKNFEEKLNKFPKIEKIHLKKIGNYIPNELISFRTSSIDIRNFVDLIDNFKYLNSKVNKSKSESLKLSNLAHNMGCVYDKIEDYEKAIILYEIGCINGNCRSFFALIMIYCQLEYYELFKFYFETVNEMLKFMKNNLETAYNFYIKDYRLLIEIVRDIEKKNLKKNACLLNFN